MKPIKKLQSDKQNKSFFLLSLFAILIVLVMFSPSWATTYYVDATNGLDKNNGLSEATAWKTIGRVNASRFNPGNQILFKRGETWREQLNISSSGDADSLITYGAYGIGDNPVISGADFVMEWTQYASNVWKSAMSKEPKMVIFHGTLGKRQNSIDSVHADNDWYWLSNILYVYSENQPETEIEASSRDYAIYINNISYVALNDLSVRHAESRGILGLHTNNILVDSILVDTVYDINIFFGASDNLIIRKVISRNCQVQHGLYLDGYEINGTDNPIVESSEFYNNAGCGIELNANRAYAVKEPIIRYCKIYSNGTAGIQDLASIRGKYYYNLIYSNGDCAIKLNYDPYENPNAEFSSKNAEVYNNTIVAMGRGTRGIFVTPYSTGHIIKNNIIQWDGGLNEIIRVSTGGDATLDNNLYYKSDFTNVFHWNGKWYSSLTDWQKISGQDADTIATDPKFASSNPRSTEDFFLQHDSPCIGRGSNVGLLRDYLNYPLPVGGERAIGAFEPQSMTPPTNFRVQINN